MSTGTVTEYAGNYIYENGVLQFFNTPEGYATPNGKGGYDYVYQYKDHLGNVRLSYTDVEGNLEIEEENNYYPFGLKHKGYNNVINGEEYNYKTFQGQEVNEELGLNWLSFKYRNYDPSIGRFFNVDPLTEEYMDWAPYVFSGNRVLDARELEGLEPFSIHATQDAAALNFSEHYNGQSISQNVEIGTKIYSTPDSNGNATFSYGNPVVGDNDGVNISNSVVPKGSKYTSFAHTHAGYDFRYDNDEFSGTTGSASDGGDIGLAENFSVDAYVATPEGSLKKYDHLNNSINTLSTEITSDPAHPNRLNGIDPEVPIEPQPAALPEVKIKKVEINIPKI